VPFRGQNKNALDLQWKIEGV